MEQGIQIDIEQKLNDALNQVLKENNLSLYLKPFKADYSNSVTIFPKEDAVTKLLPIDTKAVTTIAPNNVTDSAFLVRGYVSYGFASRVAMQDPSIVAFSLAPVLQAMLNEAAYRSQEVANGLAKIQFKYPGSNKILRSMEEYAGYEIRLYVESSEE